MTAIGPLGGTCVCGRVGAFHINDLIRALPAPVALDLRIRHGSTVRSFVTKELATVVTPRDAGANAWWRLVSA